MQSKNTKPLGEHLENRSIEAKKKYADYLFALAQFTTTGFLLILAYPITKIFDLVINNFDKYKVVKFETILNCTFNVVPILMIVWILILIIQQNISKKLENKGMDIYDSISKVNAKNNQ